MAWIKIGSSGNGVGEIIGEKLLRLEDWLECEGMRER